MTSCAPDEDMDMDGRFYGIGPTAPFKNKKKFSKRHTPKDKSPPHMSAFDDHMEGSRYRGEDICSQCGYRRDSTVYCTVSHLHHGNGSPLTPTHGHGGTSPSKSKKRSHKTPKQHSCSPTNEDDHAAYKGPPEYMHGATYSIGDAMITVSAASSPEHAGAEDETAADLEDTNETAGEGSSMTQYYCYTDEKGDTYYYAAEMRDTVPNSQHHVPAAGAEAPAAEEETESHPQVYVYTYVDEDGVQQTVMVQGEPDAEECEDDEDIEDDERMMSHRARDGGSQQAEDDSGKKQKKKKRSFVSTISSFFQRRNRRALQTDDSDDFGGNNSSSFSATQDTQYYRDPTSGLSHVTGVDEAVEAMVESLEPPERKKFEKERRRLVKDLEEHEKTHRSKLCKERRSYVEELVRERRACMLNLRDDESRQKWVSKGEPM